MAAVGSVLASPAISGPPVNRRCLVARTSGGESLSDVSRNCHLIYCHPALPSSLGPILLLPLHFYRICHYSPHYYLYSPLFTHAMGHARLVLFATIALHHCFHLILFCL